MHWNAQDERVCQMHKCELNVSKQWKCVFQVQGTNDSSVVSKVSAAAQGYFHDEFLKHFVCKVTRRAPLINRYMLAQPQGLQFFSPRISDSPRLKT